MTNPPCFHWHDTNTDEPPDGVEVVGMWIDSDGTTSTMPVVWHHPLGRTPGVPVGWTYDDMAVREPHAWCANLDARDAPTPAMQHGTTLARIRSARIGANTSDQFLTTYDQITGYTGPTPPTVGDTAPVKHRKTTTATAAIWTLITITMGFALGFGLGAATANDNQWVANILVVALIAAVAVGDVILMRGRRHAHP